MHPSHSSFTENLRKKQTNGGHKFLFSKYIYIIYPVNYLAPEFSYIFISVTILQTILESNINAVYNFQLILLFPNRLFSLRVYLLFI